MLEHSPAMLETGATDVGSDIDESETHKPTMAQTRRRCCKPATTMLQTGRHKAMLESHGLTSKDEPHKATTIVLHREGRAAPSTSIYYTAGGM